MAAVCGGGIALPFAVAQQPPTESGQPDGPKSPFDLSEARRRFFDTLFDTELPFTNPDSAWEFSIRPKFSDLDDEDYTRLPYEFRYGFTEDTEGLIGHTPFFDNPFSSGGQSSLGYLNLGLKQRLDSYDDRYQVAVGAKATLPLEEVPADPWEIRANFASYEPYVSVIRQENVRARWQQVLNLSYQYIDESPFGVETGVAEKPNSLFHLRPGIIFKPPGEWRYSLEFEYVTDRLDGGEDDAYVLSPGITWFPNRVERSIPIPGDFEIGLTLGYVFQHLPENAESSDIRAAVRLRWRLDSQSKERLKKYLKGTLEE